jgi:hypothetical protein
MKRKRTLSDLRYLTLFPKGVAVPQGLTTEQWAEVSRRRGRIAKAVSCTDRHWRVVTFQDGHEELAYLTARRGYVYRGLLLRRLLPVWAVKGTRTAF